VKQNILHIYLRYLSHYHPGLVQVKFCQSLYIQTVVLTLYYSS